MVAGPPVLADRCPERNRCVRRGRRLHFGDGLSDVRMAPVAKIGAAQIRTSEEPLR